MPITISPASAPGPTSVTLSMPGGYIAKATATTCSGQPVPVKVDGLTATPETSHPVFLTWVVESSGHGTGVSTAYSLTSRDGCKASVKPSAITSKDLPSAHSGTTGHSVAVTSAPSHGLPLWVPGSGVVAVLMVGTILARMFSGRRGYRGGHRG